MPVAALYGDFVAREYRRLHGDDVVIPFGLIEYSQVPRSGRLYIEIMMDAPFESYRWTYLTNWRCFAFAHQMKRMLHDLTSKCL